MTLSARFPLPRMSPDGFLLGPPAPCACPAHVTPSSMTGQMSPFRPSKPSSAGSRTASQRASAPGARPGDLLSGRSRVGVAVGAQIMQLDTDIRNYECPVEVLLAGNHSI